MEKNNRELNQKEISQSWQDSDKEKNQELNQNRDCLFGKEIDDKQILEQDITQNNFKCVLCGECCRPIVLVDEEDIKKIEEQGYNKNEFLDYDPMKENIISSAVDADSYNIKCDSDYNKYSNKINNKNNLKILKGIEQEKVKSKNTIKQENGICTFLVKGKNENEFICKIYPFRPKVCKNYPFMEKITVIRDCRPKYHVPLRKIKDIINKN